MSEQPDGGLTNRFGLYFGLAALYVLLSAILNQVDTAAEATVGKLFITVAGLLLGKDTTPISWKPSLLIEIKAFINPGMITGILIGLTDVNNVKQLYRAMLPGLILLIPLGLIILVPQGIWLSMGIGSFILATLPYALIGGTVGWMYKQKKFSALTNGLTGRRLG